MLDQLFWSNKMKILTREEKIEKYKIFKQKYVEERLFDDDVSAKTIVEKINNFLKKYNIDDAEIDVEMNDDGYDYRFDYVKISRSGVEKTTEEIDKEIEFCEKCEEQQKEQYKQTIKAREEREKELYEKLKKKYEK